MRKRREASLGTKEPRSRGRRLARRLSLLVGAASIGMVVSLSAAQAAAATTVTNVVPKEACPGEEVTFVGSGMKTGAGQRANVMWNDSVGIQEQFGKLHEADLTEHQNLKALETSVSTATKAVVPLFFQLWEGPTGVHKSGKGFVQFEGVGTKFEFIFKNLYDCFGAGGGGGGTGPTGPTGPSEGPTGPTGRQRRSRSDRRHRRNRRDRRKRRNRSRQRRDRRDRHHRRRRDRRDRPDR